MSKLSVVHLVRQVNGITPFQNFIYSYMQHSAGIQHELIILFKGFVDPEAIRPYKDLLRDVEYKEMLVPDKGFDLIPYFLAAEKFDSDYFCYLNSFSLINDYDWLLKLYAHIIEPGVGLVGATASWGRIMPKQQGGTPNPPLWMKILRPLTWRLVALYFDYYFNPFPNHHIRTNGFIIARRSMLKIERKTNISKMDAYKLESGKNSITRQVERMGLRVLVVGKDGKAYEKQDWNLSNTFWCPGQSNLLISDNQTRKYENGSDEEKAKLELFAWGQAAGGTNSDLVT